MQAIDIMIKTQGFIMLFKKNSQYFLILIFSTLLFIVTTPLLAEEASTSVQIFANGSQEPITINPSDKLTLDISLSPGVNNDVNSDWWLYAETTHGRYFYDIEQHNWIKKERSVNYQGELIDISKYNTFSDSDLPEGIYKVFFGIDTTANGVKDSDWTFQTAKINVSSSAVPIEIIQQNDFVLQAMNEIYLWNTELPVLNATQYASPEDLLSHLMYDPLDKWSFIMDKEKFITFFEEGKSIGLGFSPSAAFLSPSINNKLAFKIGSVVEGSPASLEGIVRGDTLLAINNKTIDQIESEDLWETIFGEDELGVHVKLQVQNQLGIERDVTLIKDWIDQKSVEKFFTTESSVDSTKKIGYLLFSSFIEPSFHQLQEAFSHFKQENINDLVLDLRYNHGGRGDVATYLGSLIKGDYQIEQEFSQITNNKQEINRVFFSNEVDALNLKRIVVLTSKATCSASELLINSLQPYINVIIIGQKTCGKPVGMQPWVFGDKLLVAISLKVSNSLGEGDYFSGISPTCSVQENFNEGLGNPQETLYKEALYFIQNGKCSNQPRSVRKKGYINKTIPLKGFKAMVGIF